MFRCIKDLALSDSLYAAKRPHPVAINPLSFEMEMTGG
jgi:hypothetical protein